MNFWAPISHRVNTPPQRGWGILPDLQRLRINIPPSHPLRSEWTALHQGIKV